MYLAQRPAYFLMTLEDLSLSANRQLLRAFLRGPNRWQSEGAKSELWAGCSRISQFSFWMVLMVRSAICGRASSCKEQTPCDVFPLWMVRIAGLSSSLKVSQQFILVTVAPLSISISKLDHWDSQNTVNKSLLARNAKQIFGKRRRLCFHRMLCRSVSGSY